MSTSKRLVSLLMVLVLMLGILAVPALAANAPDEGIVLVVAAQQLPL